MHMQIHILTKNYNFKTQIITWKTVLQIVLINAQKYIEMLYICTQELINNLTLSKAKRFFRIKHFMYVLYILMKNNRCYRYYPLLSFND